MARKGRKPEGTGDRKDLDSRPSSNCDADLLQAVYRDLVASDFPERHGVTREAVGRFFSRLATSLGTPSPGDLLTINSDATSRGNPGPSAIGYVIRSGSTGPVRECSRYIGIATRHEAAYRALLEALTEISAFGIVVRHVTIECGSELVVRQVKGEWRARHVPLKKMLVRIRRLLDKLPSWEIRVAGRGGNRKADVLAGGALLRHLQG